MTRRRWAERRPAEAVHEPPASPDAAGRPPRFRHYLLLTLAFWLFLVLQAVVLIRSLGSGQTVVLFSVFLGASFLAACLFDYVWLRPRR